MYWIGLIFALISGLLSIALFRNFVRRLIPQISSHHIDKALVAILIGGLTIAASIHLIDQRQINILQKKVETQSTFIERQREEKAVLEQKILQLVNKIQLDSSNIFRTSSGYSILVRFKASRNEPLGRVIFELRLPANSSGKITDFWPTRYGSPFVYQDNSLSISSDYKMAQLHYDLWGNKPALQINISAPINSRIIGFEIRGNHDLEPITISIDPQKDYPSGSEKRHVSEGSIRF
jgi:hypothetical protein